MLDQPETQTDPQEDDQIECWACLRRFTPASPDHCFCSVACYETMADSPFMLSKLPAPIAPQKTCVCGQQFAERYAGQTACSPPHLGMIRCGKCQAIFKPAHHLTRYCPACAGGGAPTVVTCRCGAEFETTDRRQRYCPTCATLPQWQRGRPATTNRRCLTCGHQFEVVHGMLQYHCSRECAWPVAWDG